jgi:hypothetical protein
MTRKSTFLIKNDPYKLIIKYIFNLSRPMAQEKSSLPNFNDGVFLKYLLIISVLIYRDPIYF